MFDMPIREWFQMERERMRAMTWKQRFRHIWEYYKLHILILLAIILALVIWHESVRYGRQEVVLSGAFINVDTSAEGYTAIKGYAEAAGHPEARSDVIETLVINFRNPDPRSDDASMISQLDAMIAAKGLDYLICDADTLQWYAAADALLDLSELFPADDLVVCPTAEGEQRAVGLPLTGSTFETQYGFRNDACFAVLVNAPHTDEIPAFVAWLR